MTVVLETGTGRPQARVAIGLPAYGAAADLTETLESLLSQTYAAFALVVCDDSPTDDVRRVVEKYAAVDARVDYSANLRRLGLAGNWRRAFAVVTALHPEAELFAWASDHDVWHPRWIEALVAALDADDDAVVAVSDTAALSSGNVLVRRPPSLSQVDAPTAVARVRQVCRAVRAGDAVYGLFRVDAVRGAGVFRGVVYGDRLLLAEVGLAGRIVRVPEVLWYRRPTGRFSKGRQRDACFPGRRPVHAWLPWPTVHAAAIGWFVAVRGDRRPAVGRLDGLAAAGTYLVTSSEVALASRGRKIRRRLRRRRVDLGRWTKRKFRSLRSRVKRRLRRSARWMGGQAAGLRRRLASRRSR